MKKYAWFNNFVVPQPRIDANTLSLSLSLSLTLSLTLSYNRAKTILNKRKDKNKT
jgi:hypothetical protein